MEKKELIGRKVKGFKFEDEKHARLSYNCLMDNFRNVIGVIEWYKTYDDSYSVAFNGNTWHYPAELIEQHLVAETSMSDRGCNLAPLKNTEMNYFKTKNILNREITVVVVATEDGQVKSGYSVLSPEDKPNKELAKKIALGRATKKNITPEMTITESMKQKYILAAIANKLLSDIERGDIVIKGIKS